MTSLTAIGAGVHVWQPAGGLSNSTVVGNDGAALCVDLQARPSLAHAMREAIERQVGRLEVVALTHAHADHMLGAAVFPDVPLIAQREAALAIRDRGESERALLASAMADHAEELVDTPLPSPSILVEDSYTVQIADRDVRLLAVGPAHTPGDLVAFDVASGILATGDLVFNGYFPVLRDASCAGWIAALERLIDLAPAKVVPGHGPVASPACLVDMRSLLADLQSQVAEALAAGITGAGLHERVKVPERFASLERIDRLGMAIERIAQELSQGQAEQ